MNEQELCKKKLIDLSRQANRKGIVLFSDFLNLNELNIYHQNEKFFETKTEASGGVPFAERQIVAFIPDALSLRDIKDSDIFQSEISVLHISPLNKKYSEALSHRDYLGSILNLGIERGMIGDILITDSEAIVFVKMQMQEFLTENITRIRHTSVLATIDELTDFHYSPRYEEIKGTVASVRLDSLLSVAFSSSRSKLSGLIEGGKVFVNGRLITSNAYQVKEHDIISVRGMGKFEFIETLAFTKKKRIYVLIHKYV